MSLKSKKGSRASNPPAKGVGKARPWPDLPQQLVHLISRQSSLMQSITAFSGITKSWVATPTPRKCNPTCKSQWPQLYENGDRKEKPHLRQEFSIAIREDYEFPGYRKMPPTHWPYPWEYFVGCSHGVMVAKNSYNPTNYILVAPERRMVCHLPCWDESIPFKLATVSSHVIDRNQFAVMVLTGTSSPAFLFCRFFSPREQDKFEWVRQDNTLVDPYSSNKSSIQFSNAIGFGGKFYALSVQGSLAVIEDLNESQLTVTALSKHRAVPSVSCKHFRECLVESCGEILLVFLISQKAFNVVDHVEVFRLNAAQLSWDKMERLGGDDRTLFVGADCCMSVNASEAGCRNNCIYFTQLSVEGWWLFDMETNCITPVGWLNSEATVPDRAKRTRHIWFTGLQKWPFARS